MKIDFIFAQAVNLTVVLGLFLAGQMGLMDEKMALSFSVILGFSWLAAVFIDELNKRQK